MDLMKDITKEVTIQYLQETKIRDERELWKYRIFLKVKIS